MLPTLWQEVALENIFSLLIYCCMGCACICVGFFLIHISMSDMWSYGSSGRECFGIQYVCLGMYFGVHVYIAV